MLGHLNLSFSWTDTCHLGLNLALTLLAVGVVLDQHELQVVHLDAGERVFGEVEPEAA